MLKASRLERQTKKLKQIDAGGGCICYMHNPNPLTNESIAL